MMPLEVMSIDLGATNELIAILVVIVTAIGAIIKIYMTIIAKINESSEVNAERNSEIIISLTKNTQVLSMLVDEVADMRTHSEKIAKNTERIAVIENACEIYHRKDKENE